MSYSDTQIINLGLSKLSQTKVSTISPGKSPIEVHCMQYPHWRRSELQKRRWHFSVYEATLVLTETLPDGVERRYAYAPPQQMIQPIRRENESWVFQGNRFYQYGNDTFKLLYKKDVLEGEFDPLFAEVMACRVAVECAAFSTETATKRDQMKADYAEAIRTAGQQNAFVRGTEGTSENDNNFSWLTARL